MSFHGQPILAPLRQRRDHDCLDQATHQVAGLGRRLAVAAVKRLGEIAHHAAIVLSDPWVKGYRRGRFLRRQFRLQRRALGLEGGQLLLDRGAAQGAVGHLVDQPVRPALGFGQVGFQLASSAPDVSIALVHFEARLFHGGGDDVRREQAIPEGSQDPIGDVGALDASAVVAGGRTALASPGADEPLLRAAADHRAAATAACELAAEQVPRANGGQR
ncbi:hypothetical protein U0030_16810 [Brevundimonas bullata]|nr:hypothetical protein U0030_16810 [Brevundimonas bullata]